MLICKLWLWLNLSKPPRHFCPVTVLQFMLFPFCSSVVDFDLKAGGYCRNFLILSETQSFLISASTWLAVSRLGLEIAPAETHQ